MSDKDTRALLSHVLLRWKTSRSDALDAGAPMLGDVHAALTMRARKRLSGRVRRR
jgi:hypothetical protein